uniref:F-box domain-containing protein n=1 Tax=Heterorhabditis bacteriophora TaxID=37862 RepID=A0A1I7X9Q5_HETBA
MLRNLPMARLSPKRVAIESALPELVALDAVCYQWSWAPLCL